jgi:pimeloyl-ACP methyl ester carboxylesterase
MTARANDTVERFVLSVDEQELVDLKQRLRIARFPDDDPAPGWRHGVPVAEMKRLRDYWLNQYDWRRCERRLNDIGQFKTVIDGLGVHFLHARSPEPNALPLVLTHGWPGSVVEFLKVIGPLTNPTAHGGEAADAFHVIAPSLPGYGFSDSAPAADWDPRPVAKVWRKLMQRLGYDRYVAQGGDWGSAVTVELGMLAPPELLGVHVNMMAVIPDTDDLATLTEKEKKLLADQAEFRARGTGYSEIQRTRPQTLGYGLADSPIGQAAWVYEKFWDWSDCNGHPLNSFTLDELLDNIMLYWLPNRGASSGRIYAATMGPDADGYYRNGFQPLSLPVGVSVFPKEMSRPSRRWAEKKFSNLIHWNELDRGGHFAAFEVPELYVNEIRTCFRKLR